MNPVELVRGSAPVILALPHTGTWLPDAVRARLTPLGLTLGDTDWHVERLYADLLPGASTVRATFHRYLIDANRDPSGASLYPGQNTTGLVPTTDFDGSPLWHEPPSEAQIEQRRQAFHAPYHAALAAEIARVRAQHGVAILYDCHSIRSVVPYLFEGTLPDFNIGTDEGRTCTPVVERTVERICRDAKGFSTVLNGRFKGGWTVRHHARPGHGVHAVQMELAQRTHLSTETPPFGYDADKATRLREPLRAVLEALSTLAPSLAAPADTRPTTDATVDATTDATAHQEPAR